MQHYFFRWKGTKFNRNDIKTLIKSVFDDILCFSPPFSSIEDIDSYSSSDFSFYIDFKVSYVTYRIVVSYSSDFIASAGLMIISDSVIHSIGSIPSYTFCNILDSIVGGK